MDWVREFIVTPKSLGKGGERISAVIYFILPITFEMYRTTKCTKVTQCVKLNPQNQKMSLKSRENKRIYKKKIMYLGSRQALTIAWTLGAHALGTEF